MSEKIIKNWLALAEYDYETAKAMMQSGRYIYVAFTCQQAVEKRLKALFVQDHQTTPPYTHNLLTLASKISCSQALLCDYQETLEELNSYYIESRYTEDLEQISKGLDAYAAKALYTKTGALLEWLKTRR
ncbi:MAG: HEPN domain-containing protein [Planctomycetota bacterium]